MVDCYPMYTIQWLFPWIVSIKIAICITNVSCFYTEYNICVFYSYVYWFIFFTFLLFRIVLSVIFVYLNLTYATTL